MAARKQDPSAELPSVAAEARSLALAGQQQRAVDLLSAALARPRLSAAARVGLLEARSESLLTLAESARAEADALEARRLADASGSKALRIRARLCHVFVLWRLER